MRPVLRALVARGRVLLGQVETKVRASVSAGTVAAGAAWLLGRYVYHGQVPDSMRSVIDVAAPVVAGAVAGWLAKHTPRTDPPPVVVEVKPAA